MSLKLREEKDDVIPPGERNGTDSWSRRMRNFWSWEEAGREGDEQCIVLVSFKCDQCLGFQGRTQETKNNWELEPRARRMRWLAGVSVQKSPLENARSSEAIGAAWVERGGRGRRPSSLQALWGGGQLLRKRLGACLGTRYLTPWAWRGSSNVICLLPPSLAAPTRWLSRLGAQCGPTRKRFPTTGSSSPGGMSSLMENTNCHELRTPESSPSRATINLSSPLSCFPFGFN